VRLSARILWFGLAGIAGFAVDAGVVTVMTTHGLDPRPARLFSFLLAIVTTWLINRRHAFGDRVGKPSLAEFLRYASASSLAALINLGVFMGLVSAQTYFAAQPMLAVAIATACSMSFNYWSYLKLVFPGRR
jgi:putative flippase GtrA